MPDMGEGDDNKIVKWYFKVGDVIQHGDILCDIQTPDFTFGMETDDECLAVMGEILVPEGTDEAVPDNEPICILLHQPVEKKQKSKSKSEDVVKEEST